MNIDIVVLAIITICHFLFSAFVKYATYDFANSKGIQNGPKVYYSVKLAPEMTGFSVSCVSKNLDIVYIGLTPKKYTSYKNKAMYEIRIGRTAELYDRSTSSTRLARTAACKKSEWDNRCVYSPQFATYWIAWDNSRIRFGPGHVVGKDAYWNKDVSHIGYEVNYLSFAGGTKTKHATFKIYDGNSLSFLSFLV